jgi:hypothetical protein
MTSPFSALGAQALRGLNARNMMSGYQNMAARDMLGNMLMPMMMGGGKGGGGMMSIISMLMRMMGGGGKGG